VKSLDMGWRNWI